MNTMLAGLCNLCDDYGHTNFDLMCELPHEIANLGGEATNIDPAPVARQLRNHQTLAERHSSCLELCLTHAFGTCSEEHPDSLHEMTGFNVACDNLTSALQESSSRVAKEKLNQKLQETVNTHWDYVSHLLRTKHQTDYYQYVLKNLKPGECVVVVVYKMKLELGK